jgi:hypothetical protein
MLIYTKNKYYEMACIEFNPNEDNSLRPYHVIIKL